MCHHPLGTNTTSPASCVHSSGAASGPSVGATRANHSAGAGSARRSGAVSPHHPMPRSAARRSSSSADGASHRSPAGGAATRGG